MDDAEAGGADDADGADGPDDADGVCEVFSSGAGTEGVDAGETSEKVQQGCDEEGDPESEYMSPPDPLRY